jgi:hypothetical protein
VRGGAGDPQPLRRLGHGQCPLDLQDRRQQQGVIDTRDRGPAGLVLAAQLANFPDIRTAVIDRKDGPLEVGQADGVACRTVEMFEAFGLADG